MEIVAQMRRRRWIPVGGEGLRAPNPGFHEVNRWSLAWRHVETAFPQRWPVACYGVLAFVAPVLVFLPGLSVLA
jgi:hypothetical protein